MQYTTLQLKQIWRQIQKYDRDNTKIMKGLSVMFTEQHTPFINHYHPIDFIKIIDPRLYDILSYVYWEVRPSKNMGPFKVSYPDGSSILVNGDVCGFVNYCKKEGLVSD